MMKAQLGKAAIYYLLQFVSDVVFVKTCLWSEEDRALANNYANILLKLKLNVDAAHNRSDTLKHAQALTNIAVKKLLIDDMITLEQAQQMDKISDKKINLLISKKGLQAIASGHINFQALRKMTIAELENKIKNPSAATPFQNIKIHPTSIHLSSSSNTCFA